MQATTPERLVWREPPEHRELQELRANRDSRDSRPSRAARDRRLQKGRNVTSIRNLRAGERRRAKRVYRACRVSQDCRQRDRSRRVGTSDAAPRKVARAAHRERQGGLGKMEPTVHPANQEAPERLAGWANPASPASMASPEVLPWTVVHQEFLDPQDAQASPECQDILVPPSRWD